MAIKFRITIEERFGIIQKLLGVGFEIHPRENTLSNFFPVDRSFDEANPMATVG
ncbi:MAG: hypothetical protein JO077_00805 [Verrucomicrobia bacterium]|nr:hypothetical protein [Verrucomicrobiota bacterium]